MKKVNDSNIRIVVIVGNNQRKFQMVCSVHANIHQLKIEIGKKLDIPILDSHIDLFYKGDRSMKATSTLLQNEVQDNSYITANVSRLKVVEHLALQGKKKSNKQSNKNRIDMMGLSVVCSCTNSKCTNYNQDVEVYYGFGNFPILILTSETKCDICPYKSLFPPSMLCKSIRASHCYYKLKGIEINSCGIPIPKESNFIKTQTQKEIHQFISQRNWNINMQIIIKQL